MRWVAEIMNEDSLSPSFKLEYRLRTRYEFAQSQVVCALTYYTILPTLRPHPLVILAVRTLLNSGSSTFPSLTNPWVAGIVAKPIV